MKILEICRSMPWHMAGGLENHAWDLVRGFAGAGDEVHLLTTRAPKGSIAPRMPPGIVLHELSGGRPGHYSSGAMLALAREAERLDETVRFDAIHSQGFAAFAFPVRMHARHVVTVHGTLFSETELHGPVFRALGPRGKAAAVWRNKHRVASVFTYKRLLRRSRAIVVDSEFTRRELMRSNARLAEKIRLAPLGIHPERVPPAMRRTAGAGTELRFLSVGRLTRMKGMHVALEALRLLPPQGWSWTIAGTGPELESLRAATRDLKLDAQVRWLGEAPASRLVSLYSEHDVFLYPELGSPAFGLVALEALLAGMPVVASDRGAIPEVVDRESGWIFPGGDSDALAKLLGSLLFDRGAIGAKAERIRERALERFSFEGMVKETRRALAEAGRTF